MPRLDAASISIRSSAEPLIISRHDSHLLQGSADERGRPAQFSSYPLLLSGPKGVRTPGLRGPGSPPRLAGAVSETPALREEIGSGKGGWPVRGPASPPLSATAAHLPRPR